MSLLIEEYCRFSFFYYNYVLVAFPYILIFIFSNGLVQSKNYNLINNTMTLILETVGTEKYL